MNEPVTGVLLHDDRTEVMPYDALLSRRSFYNFVICYCYQGNVVTEMPYHYVVSYMFNGYIDVSIKVLLHDVVTAVPYRVVVIKISSDVVTEVLLNNVV